MDSNLTTANKYFRSGSLKDAEIFYEKALKDFLPESLKKYCCQQINDINNSFSENKFPNVVISAANSKFFSSVLIFLEGIYKNSISCVDKILIFDLGFEYWQLDVLRKLKKVEIFNYSADTAILYEPYKKFNIHDTSTYFFKVYAFNEGIKLLKKKFNSNRLNVLWIDSGNKVNKSLNSIFSIIEREHWFFIDHSDVKYFYKNSENYLASCLSPVMFQAKDVKLNLPDKEILKQKYIKANFFGVHSGLSSTENLIEKHKDICCNTECLNDPRLIENFKLKNFWNKYLNIKDDNFLYKFGRHEQSIWSYLVAIKKIKVRNSLPFSFTCAAGTGSLSKDKLADKIREILRDNFSEFSLYINKFLENCYALENEKYNEKENDEESIIENYIEKSYKLYISEKKFEGIGFPIPNIGLSSTVLLHRGSMSRTDEYKYSGRIINNYKNIRNDIFVLLGNGPSLADVNLAGLNKYHTFGLNAAYRVYEKINFWPKYFGCFDALVCSHHSGNFKKLILNSPIEKFFFVGFNDKGEDIFEKEIKEHKKFQKINFKYRTNSEKQMIDILSTSFSNFIDMRTSGSNVIQSALLMGYRKFILLGVDQNYVEVVDGAKTNKNYHKLIMEKTPDKNPNYWFSDYQQKGDKFNRPNLQKTQIPAWNNLSMTLQTLGIKCSIYNCSPITKLEAFPKASLNFALNKLSNTNVVDLQDYKSPNQFYSFD